MMGRRASLIMVAALFFGCDRSSSDVVELREEAPLAASPSPVPPGPHVGAIAEAERDAEPAADARLEAVGGRPIAGAVRLYETEAGVRIIVTVERAQEGLYGVHVHEKGDCSDPKQGSMGAHFAPSSHEHALPSEGGDRHLGDLGNIEVGADGSGRLELTVPSATLRPGDARSFLGKAAVLHEQADMGRRSQPAGGSGLPIACGVIEPG